MKLWIIITLLLFPAFLITGKFYYYEGDTAKVYNYISLSDDMGLRPYGGFMTKELWINENLTTIQTENIYPSSLSIHSAVLRSLRIWSGLKSETFILIVHSFIGLCMAVTCTWYLALMKKEFGFSALVLLFPILLISKGISFRATTIFSPGPTLILPYISAWYFFKKKPFLLSCLAIALLVALKVSFHYDYVTTIILSTTIPLLYYDIQNRTPWKKILQRIVMLNTICTISVCLILILHVLKLSLYMNSLPEGFSLLADIVNARMLNQGDLSTADQVTFWNVIEIYWVERILIQLPITIGHLLTFYFFSMLYYLTSYHRINNFRLKTLALTTFASLIASLSWLIAKDHVYVHVWMNHFIIACPFTLMFTLWMNELVKSTYSAYDTNLQK